MERNWRYGMTDREALRAEIRRHVTERRDLMRRALEAGGAEDPEKTVSKGMPQSLLFMVELVPFIHRLWGHLPEGSRRTVLDVGPENFAGTALLARLHAPESFNRLKLNVSALDISDEFALLGELVAPDVELLVGDITSVRDRAWDMVIASHVVEHVEDPVGFMCGLQELAREFVVIACPWRENPIVTPDHVSTIDKEVVMAAGARDLTIYTNFSWGKMREVCMFWLPGQAGGNVRR